jgi:hypothetical protein
MGELLDALNAADQKPVAPSRSAIDQVGELFRSASRRVNETVAAAQEPGMPLDMLSQWARRAPLQALAAAFLVGIMTARRSSRNT